MSPTVYTNIKPARMSHRTDHITPIRRILIDGQPVLALFDCNHTDPLDDALILGLPCDPKDTLGWLTSRPTKADLKRMACALRERQDKMTEALPLFPVV